MRNRIITVAFFFTAFYCFGAGIMDGFVVYHGWRFVDDPAFTKLHREQGARIVPLFVLPYLIFTILNIFMFWFRIKVIPRKLVVIAFLSSMIGWISSAFIQIPMQLQLDQGRNAELVEQLIYTDWIRVVASLLLAGSVLLMLNRVCIAATTTARAARPAMKMPQ